MVDSPRVSDIIPSKEFIMLTINQYTGNWQYALIPTPSAPKVGAMVRIHDSADAREYDDFCQIIKWEKKDIEFVRWMPRLKMNVYRIVKARN
jgi:hypothetical protein